MELPTSTWPHNSCLFSRSLVVAKVEQVRRMAQAGNSLPIWTGAADSDTGVGAPSSYGNWEALYLKVGEALVWKEGEAMLEALRSVEAVDADFITRINGPGKNGVRGRGSERAISGHFDVSNWSVAEARLKSDDAEVLIFKAKCTPSMKSEVI